MKKSLISLLVLLMTAVTGAWAQEETLLTTIESTGNADFKSGSKTFDNIATVTFSGEVINVGDNYGWFSDQERTLTVTAAEGYTITRVKFYTTSGSAFDEEAPFEAILVRGDIHFITKVNGTSIGVVGVTKIEVYGYVTPNHSANNTWTLAATPAFNVELEMEYFNITVPTANTADIYAGSTTPLINAGSTTEDGATMKYLVTATNEQPTSTDGFSADVPTAEGRTAGTYYVWYYLDLDSGDDSDISALAVEVTVSVHVTMKEGTEDATSWQGKAGTGEYQALPLEGVAAGTAVSVKYNGTKKVKSVKAKKKALNLTSPAVGQVIGDDGKNYDYASLPGGVTAVAKICYVSGSNGLALALTDEGKMNWSTAISTCAAHTPAFTGGTWKLATQVEWTNMITAAGSYTALRDGFSDISGASNLQSDYYWSSTEGGPNDASVYNFVNGSWAGGYKESVYIRVRACLAFWAQGSDPDPIELTSTDGETWTLASMPDCDVELEVEYYDEVTLTDGEAITALDTYKGQEIWVNYTRSFTSGKTSTVCLPFAYTKKEGDGSFYAFTNIEKMGNDYVATMTEPAATTLTANTPYLYKAATTGDADFSGTYTIPASLTAGSTTSNGWTFKGTFTTIEWTTAPTGTYGFSAQDANDGITQGQFVKVGSYVRIKPMRAYLQYNGSDSQFTNARSLTRAAATTSDDTLPETIGVRLISANDEVTAIGTLHTRTGEVSFDSEAWYTLDGKRLNAKPNTKGIYVNNGKKVVIK